MAKDRIYFVGNDTSARLVRASRQGPALMHVARGTLTVRVATQNDLELLLAKGVKVEDADGEPEPTGAGAQQSLATHT